MERIKELKNKLNNQIELSHSEFIEVQKYILNLLKELGLDTKENIEEVKYNLNEEDFKLILDDLD